MFWYYDLCPCCVHEDCVSLGLVEHVELLDGTLSLQIDDDGDVVEMMLPP